MSTTDADSWFPAPKARSRDRISTDTLCRPRTLYIHVEGIRTVPKEYAETVKAGGAVDPKLFYYVTTPKFEVYDESLKWMTEKIFVCDGTRLPDAVLLTYYTVEQVNDHPALG